MGASGSGMHVRNEAQPCARIERQVRRVQLIAGRRPTLCLAVRASSGSSLRLEEQALTHLAASACWTVDECQAAKAVWLEEGQGWVRAYQCFRLL